MTTWGALCIRRKASYLNVLLFSILFIFNSCKIDDIGTYYTFIGQTIGQYIKEDAEEIGLKEFYKILEETQIIGLMNAYGEFTCFAPTDEAMYSFYKSKGVNSFDELKENFRPDELKKIVYDHIIKDIDLTDSKFKEGIILNKTMSDRYITMTSSKLISEGYYYINNTVAIVNLNIDCHNGVIHVVDEVIQPVEINLAEAIDKNDKYSLFNSAMKLCMLDLLITEYEDESYNPDDHKSILEGKPTSNNGDAVLPEKRKYGYTVFMQSDSLYEAKYNVTDLDGLKSLAASIYDRTFPEDASIRDVTDRRNSLNRFISYHMLNRRLSKSMLIDVYTDKNRTTHHIETCSMFEFIETMCQNTLMEVSHFSSHKTNLLNYISDDNCVKLLEYDGAAVNGVYHEVDGVLAYDYDFRSALAAKRLRLDVASFFPELTNNGYRGGNTSLQGGLINIVFPPNYLERMHYEDYTKVMYLGSNERYCDYQGDEFLIEKGNFDFEITTPAIPKGIYEVRFGYQPTGDRAVAQFYWDNKPVGIPLDMTITAEDSKIGWEENNSEDPFGYENDKMMRNRGFMKGPASYRNSDHTWYSGDNARLNINVLRRILGRFDFQETSNHKLRIKAVKTGECMLDYLEFVPAEIIEYEDIY